MVLLEVKHVVYVPGRLECIGMTSGVLIMIVIFNASLR